MVRPVPPGPRNLLYGHRSRVFQYLDFLVAECRYAAGFGHYVAGAVIPYYTDSSGKFHALRVRAGRAIKFLSLQSRICLTGWMISSYGTDIFILRDGWFSSHGTNNFIPRDRCFHSARRITPPRGMDLFSQESAFLSKQAVEFPTERL